MSDVDLTRLHLDVYATRDGPWNPEHGELEIPEDWDFLAAGDSYVTRTVKAAGTYRVAWRPRGRSRQHRRRLGLWAPRVVIEQARAKATATETERARRGAQGARSRERSEAAYREELADAIRRLLEFPPQRVELADEIAEAASAHTAMVGSGRVGRTRSLSLDQRAALAARAYIRHHFTGYHGDLADLATQDPWDDEYLYRQAKAEAHRDVDEFLAGRTAGSRAPCVAELARPVVVMRHLWSPWRVSFQIAGRAATSAGHARDCGNPSPLGSPPRSVRSEQEGTS